MTSYEILKASVLDIIFENRNKNYGAYELRRHYNYRMGISIGIMLSTVLLLALIINSSSEQIRQVVENFSKSDTVVVTMIDDPLPPPIERPVVRQAATTPNIAREKLLNRIEIVSDFEETDFPDHDALQHAAISNNHSDGAPSSGAQPAPGKVEGGGFKGEIIPTSQEFTVLESNAEYPGGKEAWAAFLNRHLSTPAELEAGQKRVVMVKFAVGSDGSITQFQIIQSGGEAFDNEVIRVLKKMPKWKPAIQNGRNVSVMFTQPVTFMAFEE